ncbi:MAG TPA: (Fe-S)-binding protein [Geodermatophilus sp.]|nr:(Fe-S)-binding protein [Geodermatophilus sp.]
MRVALFVTCFNDTMFPESAKATVDLLERLGVDVDFPEEQTCCGQMHINTGYRTEAVPLVRRYVESFEGYDAVVAPSASCAGTVAHHHATIAAERGDAALRDGVARIAPRTYELTQFLTDVLGREDVGAYFPHRVTYHPTCHSLRALHLGDRPYRLLRAVRGLTLVDLPREEECCGFGGTFAIKNADVSVAMGSDKVRHVRATGAEVVVSADNSCLAHIGGILGRERSGVRTLHIAEVLASTERAAATTHADQPAESAQWRGLPEQRLAGRGGTHP